MSGGVKTACYAIAVAFVFGCSEAPVKTEKASAPELIHPYRKKSLTVIVSANETNIATSGRIRFRMDVHTPEGTDVTFPEVASFIESFHISDGYIEPIIADLIEIGVELDGIFGSSLADSPGRNRAHCLLNGLDDIALTLQHKDKIAAYEAAHGIA